MENTIPNEKMNQTIEILVPDQWKEYQEIKLKSLKTDPTAFAISYQQFFEQDEKEIKKDLSDPNCKNYITKIGDRIIALARYSLATPENVKHLATIHAVFVDPDFRGKGIGYSLLKRMIDDLHNNPVTVRVVLSVNNENEAPKNLYKKLGFVQFGVGEKEMKVNGKYYDMAQMELIFKDKI